MVLAAQDATVNAEAIAFLTEKFTRIPGDFDGNGTVGPEDYDLWKANFGSTMFPDADGDGNGIVDLGDYTVWRDHLAQWQEVERASLRPALPVSLSLRRRPCHSQLSPPRCYSLLVRTVYRPRSAAAIAFRRHF